MIKTDGSSPNQQGGNGPIGAAFLIDGEEVKAFQFGEEYLGESSNVAEYLAVVMALHEARERNFDEVEIQSDSQLVVKQLTGEYQVKSAKLRKFYELITKDLLLHFKSVKFTWIPRGENKEVDYAAKQAAGVV